MIWLGVALLALWALAWLVFKVVGLAVHVLLIAAVVFVVWGLAKRGARKVGL
ncbi:MAG TPA: hypothetical protein VF142_22055 [Longimicrobium sp.]